MPYRSVLSMLAAFLLMNCSTLNNRNFNTLEDQFTDIIKKDLEDNASKNTSELKIEDFIVLKIDTVTNRTLDSQLLIKTQEKIEFCNAMADLYISMSESNVRLGKLMKKLKRGTQDNAPEDIKNDSRMGQVYKDSAVYYQHLDSSIRVRISNITAPNSFYRVKVFIKAIERKDNDSTNIFGSQIYYFTKDKDIVNLSELK